MLRLLIILSIISPCLSAAEFILSAPPRESREVGKNLYGPFAKHLTVVLGSKVTYRHPGNWLRYQRSVKRDEYDFVFDGPHLVSWRIKHYGHSPLMMIPGDMVFVFVTKTENNYINTLKDFSAQKVCALPPPNLNSLVLLSQMERINKEPIIVGIKGGLKAVASGLLSNKCVAAVLPIDFYNKKLSIEQRNKLKVIHKSSPIPNQAITASGRINNDDINKIINSISSGEGLTIINSFGKRYGKSFVRTNKAKYKGTSNLIEGVILGWHGKNRNKKSYITE